MLHTLSRILSKPVSPVLKSVYSCQLPIVNWIESKNEGQRYTKLHI